MVDLSELISINELFILETKNFGALKICYPAWNDFLKLSSQFDTLKNASAEEVVREFISVVAFLSLPDKEDISLDDPKIDIADINKLSQDELNIFSKYFLEKGKEFFLNRDISLNSLEEDLSPIENLANLILEGIEKENKTNENIFRKSGVYSIHEMLNSNLNKGLSATAIMAAKAERLYKDLIPLQRQYDFLKDIEKDISSYGFLKDIGKDISSKNISSLDIINSIHPGYPERPILPIINPIEITNNKLGILIDCQDSLRNVMQQSLELFINFNSKFDRESKRTLIISIAIIFITLLSLIVSLLK